MFTVDLNAVFIIARLFELLLREKWYPIFPDFGIINSWPAQVIIAESVKE
jgi:hypothetical protein